MEQHTRPRCQVGGTPPSAPWTEATLPARDLLREVEKRRLTVRSADTAHGLTLSTANPAIILGLATTHLRVTKREHWKISLRVADDGGGEKDSFFGVFFLVLGWGFFSAHKRANFNSVSRGYTPKKVWV